METILMKLFDASAAACFIICVVLVLRLALKKAPAYMRCLLWALVGLRLLLPVSIESSLSLVPSSAPVSSYIEQKADNDTVPPPKQEVPPVIENEELAPAPFVPDVPIVPTVPEASDKPTVQAPIKGTEGGINWQAIVFSLWALGFTLMLSYMAVSYLRLSKRVKGAVVYDDTVRIFNGNGTPFILGIIRPKIYLPAGFSAEQYDCIISHEKAHIKRFDHLFKPLAFIALAIHWFNPLVWAAYITVCKDVELACDEKVIAGMDISKRKLYSATLLSCSEGRLGIATPLAFGETAIKERVKKVIYYKKPSFWIIIIAVIALILTAVLFVTSPKTETEDASEDISEDSSFDASEEPDMPAAFAVSAEKLPERGENIFVYTDPLILEDKAYTTVKITVNKPVTNFSYVELIHGDISGYHLSTKRFTKEEFTPEMSFYLKTPLRSETSQRGILYTDENGKDVVMVLLGDENGPYLKDINEKEHRFIDMAGMKAEIGELFAKEQFDYDGAEDGKCLRISCISEVKDFVFYELGVSSPIGTVPKTVLCSRESVTPDKPFYARSYIGHATHGFSITDDTGATKYYAICKNSAGMMYFWDFTKEAELWKEAQSEGNQREDTSTVDHSAERIDTNAYTQFSFGSADEFAAWLNGSSDKKVNVSYNGNITTYDIYEYQIIESQREHFKPALKYKNFTFGTGLINTRIYCRIYSDNSSSVIYTFHDSNATKITLTIPLGEESMEGDVYVYLSKDNPSITDTYEFKTRTIFAEASFDANGVICPYRVTMAQHKSRKSTVHFVFDGRLLALQNHHRDFTEEELSSISIRP